MIEQNPIIEKYKLEVKDDYLTKQTLCLEDAESNIVAKHIIYSLSKIYAQKHFSNKYSGFFESAVSPFYTGKIESTINNEGVGLGLFKYGEKYLYRHSNKPYYRFILDTSETHWTQRHLAEMLDYLRDNSIPVEILFEEINEDNQYQCILLFEEDNTLDLK
jgi:hypothetical protein